jgi:hypothetical protein
MSTQVGIETSSFAQSPHDWRSLLANTASEGEIVSFVNDQMAMWSPDEIVRLPMECRPRRVRDGEDITRWAFQLATAHCASTAQGDDEYLLDKLLVFVTAAAMHLAEVQAVPTDGLPT